MLRVCWCLTVVKVQPVDSAAYISALDYITGPAASFPWISKDSRIASLDAFPPGVNRSLGAIVEVQFPQDIADVSFDRLLT
jgi:hypothetical protein